MVEGSEIKSFTSLRTWKEAHKLVLEIYRLSKQFPTSEQYILAAQIQRAAISISSNVAEGFSRGSSRAIIQFYRIALGSLTEAQNQLLLARDLGYITSEDFNTIALQTVVVSKMVNGLIKSAERFSHNT